jgi:alpha-ribazole phosphatase/probable phosphoglycerate mutase
LGIKQSKQLGSRFKEMKIDLICCSDLKRAFDTVKIAFQERIPVLVDKRLREVNYGDFNGKPGKVVALLKQGAIKKPFPGGESYEQAMDRLHEFYKELKERYPDPRNGDAAKTVLVVGHRATQYGLDTLLGKTVEQCLKEQEPFKWQPYWEYNI